MANGYLHHQGTKFYPAPYYPIGAVYMSTEPTDPSVFFGGVWTKIQGRFLWATNNTPKTQGGSRTTDGSSASKTGSTKLTAAQSGLPAHRHYVQTFPYGGSDPSYYCISQQPGYNVDPNTNWRGGYAAENSAQSASEGHTHSMSHTHTYMPPYFEVYMWYRIA